METIKKDYIKPLIEEVLILTPSLLSGSNEASNISGSVDTDSRTDGTDDDWDF